MKGSVNHFFVCDTKILGLGPSCSNFGFCYLPDNPVFSTLIEKDHLGDWSPEKECYSWVQTIFLSSV